MLTLLVFAACSTAPSSPPTKAPSRVDTVAAPVKKAASPEAFCDSRGGGKFTWPELDGATPPETPGWTWVNVWATWCKPCVAEMPMIQEWAKKLNAAGTAVSQQFLSVDGKAEDLTAYYGAHPDAVKSPRLKDITLLTPWLEGQGLDASAALPLHLFLDETDTIRCVRMGAVGENDYDAIAAVLQGK